MNNLSNCNLTAGTGSSLVINRCQISGSDNLLSVLFLGYLPPVNQMRPIGERPQEQASYPAELLYCPDSKLAQIGLIVDPNILFPPEYPYTTGTTKILRDNFAELYEESKTIISLKPEDLIVDIGSNDGTLLSNFKKGGHQVQGIEPTERGELANKQNIPTEISFFNQEVVDLVISRRGKAKIVTATNVFAHIENIDKIVENIINLLDDHGVFISESHYLINLIETLQYDTIYHEHLRYYSLESLQYLLNKHGLEIIHAKPIPTHGGSIRVYASRKGVYEPQASVSKILQEEKSFNVEQKLKEFKQRVILSKLHLHSLLYDLKKQGKRIVGIGAPSRASTLINYVGLDEGSIDCVLEIKGSYKIGKYMPGTLIPVVEESLLFEEQPDYAILFSWHIADELIPKLTQKGFKGSYIVPLPTPKVIRI
jgi:hypothetical protein